MRNKPEGVAREFHPREKGRKNHLKRPRPSLQSARFVVEYSPETDQKKTRGFWFCEKRRDVYRERPERAIINQLKTERIDVRMDDGMRMKKTKYRLQGIGDNLSNDATASAS